MIVLLQRLLGHCWLGDRKDIQPVNGLTPTIIKGSLRTTSGICLTWSVLQQMELIKQKPKEEEME